MALVNTNFSLNIVALDKIDHIFFLKKKKKETFKKKIRTNWYKPEPKRLQS